MHHSLDAGDSMVAKGPSEVPRDQTSMVHEFFLLLCFGTLRTDSVVPRYQGNSS